MKVLLMIICVSMALPCNAKRSQAVINAAKFYLQKIDATALLAEQKRQVQTIGQTNAPTEATTPLPDETTTPPPTEATTPPPTEATTLPPTEATTLPFDEETTQEPTEESTEEPTEESTEEPTEESTEEPTEEPTEETTEAVVIDKPIRHHMVVTALFSHMLKSKIVDLIGDMHNICPVMVKYMYYLQHIMEKTKQRTKSARADSDTKDKRAFEEQNKIQMLKLGLQDILSKIREKRGAQQTTQKSNKPDKQDGITEELENDIIALDTVELPEETWDITFYVCAMFKMYRHHYY